MQIREETDTKIELPAEGSDSDTIVITGHKAQVEAARDRIVAIQNELVSFFLFSDVATVLPVFANLHVACFPLIYGPIHAKKLTGKMRICTLQYRLTNVVCC